MTDAPSRTILVVDDDPSVCAYFELLLQREGYAVVAAATAKAALNQLRYSDVRKIDLIILDLILPDSGGYEVLKTLQEDEYRGIPVVVVTLKQLDSETVEMLRQESNVRGFWNKPVDGQKFKAELHSILRSPAA